MYTVSTEASTTSSTPTKTPSPDSAKGLADAEKGQAGPAGPDEDQAMNQTATDTQQQQDRHLVGWNGDGDVENPMDWPKSKKYTMTIAYATLTFCLTFSSSIFSTATMVTAELFGVSSEVMTLGTSLFVIGFAVGPVVWGPLSELYGRKAPLFFGFACFAIFQIPVAVAQNVETIMLRRFLGGTFGSAPLAIIGGALADFWGPVERGLALGLFSGATFIGPVAGPIVGGFVTQSYLGWRWTAWLTLIMSAFFGLVAFVLCSESYAPVLLQRRAARVRFETRNLPFLVLCPLKITLSVL